jgi:hypothetical protein
MGLAERQGIGDRARVEEANLERVVGDVARETHQLIWSPRNDPISVGVDIDAMISARCMPVDQDLELHRLAVSSRPQDQMQVPRVEAVDNSSVGLRENGVLTADTPVARECPLIDRKCRGGRITMGLVLNGTTRGHEVLGIIRADIGLRGSTSFMSAASSTPMPETETVPDATV